MTKKVVQRIALTSMMMSALGASLTAAAQQSDSPGTAQNPPGGAPVAPSPEAPPYPAWLNKITLGGDVRVRYNYIDQSTGHDEGAYLRARVSAAGKINENLTANIRLSTAGTESGNVYSTSNQQLGDEGGKKGIFVDVASLDFKAGQGLVITGGRAINPFYSAGKNEMIWSADLGFEGVSVKYNLEAAGMKPFATLAYNIWTDTGNNRADINMVAGQLGTGFKAGVFSGTVAIAHYHHNGLKGAVIDANTGAGLAANTDFGRGVALGNTTTTAGSVLAFANDYQLNNAELELVYEGLPMPLFFYGAYVQNPEAADSKEGFLYGIRAGRVKDAGDLSLDVFYRELKQDAVVGNFNDATTFGGGTNNKGVRTTIQYGLMPGNILSVSGMWSENNLATTSTAYNRFLVEYLGSF